MEYEMETGILLALIKLVSTKLLQDFFEWMA